jgi:hypothetical protein
MIAQARNGYMSKINVKEITDEEFKQSIRSGFSQDKACAIAEARFERAGDSLELSVGAIKELMYTHETRSIGWKIRHPIKNYLEYSKINSLTKKLQTEKGFERADIASAMRYYDDSFSMDWGDELSNDRDAIRFAKSNKYAFKKSENKLLDVLKKASDAIGIKTVASEEVKEMQEELARVLEGKSPDREQIAVEEEDEANKNMDISMDIIPEQPEINKTMEL